MYILRAATALFREHVTKVVFRSAQWTAVRQAHLKAHPRCSACGATRLLQVHHVVPYHVNPDLELDPGNLLTLCEGSNECHLRIGHGGCFREYNPRVRHYASECAEHPDTRLNWERLSRLVRRPNCPEA